MRETDDLFVFGGFYMRKKILWELASVYGLNPDKLKAALKRERITKRLDAERYLNLFRSTGMLWVILGDSC